MARAPTSRVDLYAAIRRDAKAGRHHHRNGLRLLPNRPHHSTTRRAPVARDPEVVSDEADIPAPLGTHVVSNDTDKRRQTKLT
jgi:hypothetical protein